MIITIKQDQVYHSKHNDLTNCPDSLINALQLHIMGVAIIVYIKQKESFLSMMVHADREQDASQKFYGWIKNLMNAWANMLAYGESDPAYQELEVHFMKIM